MPDGTRKKQFIVEAVATEVQGNLATGDRDVELPLIPSKRPGTLDLSHLILMTCLPDVNVWIALVAERHIHHPAARRWFNNLRDENSHSAALRRWAFCGGREPLLKRHPHLLSGDRSRRTQRRFCFGGVAPWVCDGSVDPTANCGYAQSVMNVSLAEAQSHLPDLIHAVMGRRFAQIGPPPQSERRKVRFDGLRDRIELLPGWDDPVDPDRFPMGDL